jgi:hypothetical protein
MSAGRPRGWPGVAVAAAAVVVSLGGCGGSHPAGAATRTTVPGSLLAEARPIGRGPRFHPPATGLVPRPCQQHLGPRFGVHVEVFAADRVVLLPAGIGVRGPKRLLDGRVTSARCFGSLVTLDPTGLVLVRAGHDPPLRELFKAWGEPLSRHNLVGFASRARRAVRGFVDGHRWLGVLGDIPMRPHAEIVVETGPEVPPHHSYTFPKGF